MDYASAAATFGVAGEEIRAAPGEPGQGRKTVADAAATPGVPEEALSVPEGMTGSGVPPGVSVGGELRERAGVP